jgi:hypothetical protein
LNKIIDTPQQSNTLNDGDTEVLVRNDESITNKPITFLQAWLLPGVLMVKNTGDINFF